MFPSSLCGIKLSYYGCSDFWIDVFFKDLLGLHGWERKVVFVTALVTAAIEF